MSPLSCKLEDYLGKDSQLDRERPCGFSRNHRNSPKMGAMMSLQKVWWILLVPFLHYVLQSWQILYKSDKSLYMYTELTAVGKNLACWKECTFHSDVCDTFCFLFVCRFGMLYRSLYHFYHFHQHSLPGSLKLASYLWLSFDQQRREDLSLLQNFILWLNKERLHTRENS